MIPKLGFWQGLGCTVLVMIGQSVALAGGRPGGMPQGGMKAKLPANVQRSIPVPQVAAKGRSLGSHTTGIQVISGTQQNLGTARKLPSGISQGTPISGSLSGSLVKHSSGVGTGARTKPGPLNPGGVKPPYGGGTIPPIVVGGGTNPPSGGGTTPPAGGGTTPPSGGGTTPPSGGSNPSGHNHHHHCHVPNWWWVTPALYPRCGTVYGGYYTPTCSSVVNVSSTPLVITTTSIDDSITATVERMTLQLGESYSLKNENFGDAAGQIVLELNGLMLPALVTSWDAETIAFTLPNLGLNQSRDGVLHVLKADQSVMKSVAVNVIAAQK